MKTKKLLSFLMATSMLVSSTFLGTGTVASAKEIDLSSIEINLDKTHSVNKSDHFVSATGTDKLLTEESVSPEELVRVIITFEGDSIIDSNPLAEANWITDAQSAKIEAAQDTVISKIEKTVLGGTELDVHYKYTWLINGIACEVPYGTISEIEKIAGVESVMLQPKYESCKTDISEPNTIVDGVMIGREDTWANGYTGAGMKIAVIDTGIDEDHQNFGPLAEDKLTEDSETLEKVAEVLTSLNAYELYNNLTADDLYRSSKIAYGFNYVDKNLTINHDNDEQGDHGTHVSGIAAANDLGNGEAVGVAKDAQIYTMKVFGEGGGAYTEDILAALEDALVLDADVVNMSLGSSSGFTTDGEEIDAIYSKVKTTDTILCISAGNSATAGEKNLLGTNSNLTSNPDNSVVGSPAVYDSATSVASVENLGIKSNYFEIGGVILGYNEPSTGKNNAISTIAGQDLEIVPINGLGETVEEFGDVEGKIALVQRGKVTFSTKIANAEAAGAVACIIYNNTTGTIGMDLSSEPFSSIPAASITMSDGERIIALLEEDDSLLLHIGEGTKTIPSEEAYRLSTFSSWGVAPNLTLEPDIAAPGGNIYSTLTDGKYGLMSGTSMACPNLAGMAALVKQYARENYELTDAECHKFVNALLMSTSVPLMYSDELEFSPRNQGSGLANAYNAVTTEAYLSVDGQDVPKADLLDDPERSGSYEFSYNVTNFGERDLYYTTKTSTLTEGYVYYEEIDAECMAIAPEALSAITKETSDAVILACDYDEDGAATIADARELYVLVKHDSVDSDIAFRFDVDANEAVDRDDVQAYLDSLVGKESDADLEAEVLKVPAGKTVAVSVSVDVTDEGKEYMDAHFENGIYVEGYSYLVALNEKGVDLSLPYLAFYGDWTEAPIIDFGYYWEDEDESAANQYYNCLFSNFGKKSWTPGSNPYGEEEFDESNIVISPNGDGYSDYISDIYISLLRNAAKLNFKYENANTGDVYFDDYVEHARKSSYSDSNGVCLPFVYSWYEDEIGTYDFKDNDGNVLADGTKLLLTIEATLDYDVHEQNNLHDTWQLPIVIDTEAPVVTGYEVGTNEDGSLYLDLTFSDNYKTAGVAFVDMTGSTLFGEEVCIKGEPGEELTQRFQIKGYGNDFVVCVGDYGLNETYVEVHTEGNTCMMLSNVFYGYQISESVDEGETPYVGFASYDMTYLEATPLGAAADEKAIVAAEYVGGLVFAVDEDNTLVVIDPEDWTTRVEIATLQVPVSSLAYDEYRGYMFAQTPYGLCMLDVYSGKLSLLGNIGNIVAMTFDAEGYLYYMLDNGELAVMNLSTGSGQTLVDFGSMLEITEFDTQGLAYDTKTDILYWNCYDGEESYMITVDFNTGKLGMLDYYMGANARVLGFFMIDSSDAELDIEDFLPSAEDGE